MTHQRWRGKAALCLPRPLRPLRRRGRLINRPLQPMKTGGNNPDKRHIWSLSYKTNFNCTPFFKSSSRWRTTELNPCGCRICFSLIALSGYLIRWQMTKTPLPLPLTHKLFHTMPSLFSLPPSHTLHILSRCLTLPHKEPRSHNWPSAKLLLVRLSSFLFSHGTYAVHNNGDRFLKFLLIETELDESILFVLGGHQFFPAELWRCCRFYQV